MSSSSSTQARQGQADRIVRHGIVERLLHWSAAAAVLTLLGTAFLPILGWRFPWVGAHWITGFVLMAVVLLHGVRAAIWEDLSSMRIGADDIRDGLAMARWNLRRSMQPPPKPGKYSLAQKFIHHAFSVVIIAELVTGGMMMVKIDTPWWDRNVYWLSDAAWGYVYVVHGLAALMLITMVMVHVYFALRPEKFSFLRAMVAGWISRREYEMGHDSQRWQVDK